MAAFVLGSVGAYPLLWLMHHQSLAMIVLGQLGFVAIVGMFFGALGGAMVEAAPPEVRCSATALGYNITFGVAGGLSPLVATWLVHRTGDDLSPAFDHGRGGGVAARHAALSQPTLGRLTVSRRIDYRPRNFGLRRSRQASCASVLSSLISSTMKR